MTTLKLLKWTVFMLIPCISAQLSWRLVDSGDTMPSPPPRRDAQLAYDPHGKQLVLFGGRYNISEGTKVLGDTWLYDLNTKQWREVKTNSEDKRPTPRFSYVGGVSFGYFYVATGEGDNKILHDDIWRLNLSTEKWEELPTQEKPSYYNEQQWKTRSHQQVKPAMRYAAAGGIFPNSSRFYLSLGFGKERYADTFTYNTVDMGWFEEFSNQPPYNPTYPHARCLHAGTMMAEDELLIYGGCLTGGGTGGPCPAGDSWVFDGKSKSWTRTDGCASPRNFATLAMLPSRNGERRAVLYGGVEKSKQVLLTVESPAEQLGVFNPDTHTWVLRQAEGNIPTKRASAAMTTSTDGIYMFGGIDVQSGSVKNDLYILVGDASTADHAPVHAKCHPTFFNLAILHGILMALAWGLFLQLGAFLARYARNKRPIWFHLHQLFQIFGLLLAIGGLVVGVLSVQFDHFKFSHGIIGLVTMILGILQPLGAICRPKPPSTGEQKTARRMLWEFFHHFFGRSALILGLVNISLGVFLIISSLLIWALWFGYLGLLVLIYIVAEFSHRQRENMPESNTSPRKYVLSNRTNGFDKRRGFDNPNFN